MNKYAVAYMNLFDNDLTIEFVEAPNDIEAIYKHTKMLDIDNETDTSIDLEELKQQLFDGDILVDVKKV